MLYAGFTLTQGSVICSGLGYNGWSKTSARFDRITCVDILGVEFCTSPRDGFAYWNTATAVWLRRYVYNRFMNEDKSNSSMATLVTNLCSAFWHGFYLMYYNCFFFCAFIVEISKDVYRTRHIFWFVPSFVSTIILNILSVGALNYLAAGMILLEVPKAMTYYSNTYYYGHVMIIGLFVVFRFILSPLCRKKKPKITKTD